MPLSCITGSPWPKHSEPGHCAGQWAPVCVCVCVCFSEDNRGRHTPFTRDLFALPRAMHTIYTPHTKHQTPVSYFGSLRSVFKLRNGVKRTNRHREAGIKQSRLHRDAYLCAAELSKNIFPLCSKKNGILASERVKRSKQKVFHLVSVNQEETLPAPVW